MYTRLSELHASKEWADRAALCARQYESVAQRKAQRERESAAAGPQKKEIETELQQLVPLMNELKHDKEQCDNSRSARLTYLHTALEQYGACLRSPNKFVSLFRVMDLWFKLSSDETVAACSVVAAAFRAAPVSALMPGLLQLSARVRSVAAASAAPVRSGSLESAAGGGGGGGGGGGVQVDHPELQNVLKDVLVRMICEQPYRCLPQLLALLNDTVTEVRKSSCVFVRMCLRNGRYVVCSSVWMCTCVS